MLLELEAVGERFYFCPVNSLFTFDKEYQSTSERPNVDDMPTKVKMTSYCFCLARHPELGFSDGKRAYDDLFPSR